MIVWANVHKNRGIQHENDKKGHLQVRIIAEEHHLTRLQRGRHINQSLVAAASEKQALVSQRLHERAIHQHVDVTQQLGLLRMAQQLLIPIAGVTPDVFFGCVP